VQESTPEESEFKEGEVKEEDGVTIPQVALTLDDVTEESAQQAIGVLTEKLMLDSEEKTKLLVNFVSTSFRSILGFIKEHEEALKEISSDESSAHPLLKTLLSQLCRGSNTMDEADSNADIFSIVWLTQIATRVL
jgi:hypothetical protein